MKNVNIKNRLSTKEKLKSLLISEILFPIINELNFESANSFFINTSVNFWVWIIT